MFYAISPYILMTHDITHKNLVKVQRNHFTMIALGFIAMLVFVGFSCACCFANWSFHLTQTQNLIAGCLFISTIIFGILAIGYCLTSRHMLKRLHEAVIEENLEKQKKELNLNTNSSVKI